MATAPRIDLAERAGIPSPQSIPFQSLTGREAIGGTIVTNELLVPEEIHDEVPLAIAPGYLGDLWAYRELGEHIASSGKPVLMWEFPRQQCAKALLDPRHFLYPQRLACQALWGSIRNMQRRTDIPDINQEVVDAAGHSRGGPTVIRTAIRKPEIFRSIILDAAAGLEEQNTLMMLGRLPSFFCEEVIPGVSSGELKLEVFDLLKYIFTNPARTAVEALDVSREDITPLLDDPRIAHIAKAIYGYRGDSLVDIDRSIERSGHLVDTIRISPDITLGHLAPQTRPGVVCFDYLLMLATLNHREVAPRPPLAKVA